LEGIAWGTEGGVAESTCGKREIVIKKSGWRQGIGVAKGLVALWTDSYSEKNKTAREASKKGKGRRGGKAQRGVGVSVFLNA